MASSEWRYYGGKTCSYKSCSNSQAKTKNISYFIFPEDGERCKRWVMNSGREDLLTKSDIRKKQYKLCSLHFSEDQFMNRVNKNRLVWNAVPRVWNDIDNSSPPNTDQVCLTSMDPVSHITTTVVNQNHGEAELKLNSFDCNHILQDCSLNANTPESSNTKFLRLKVKPKLELTPKEIKLKKQLQKQYYKNRLLSQKLSKQKTTKHQVIEYMNSVLPRKGAKFFETQIELALKKSAGKRFSGEFKRFCLALHYNGPKAYRFLEQQFILPSQRSLCRWFKAVPEGEFTPLYENKKPNNQRKRAENAPKQAEKLINE